LAFQGGWPLLAVLVALLAVAVAAFFRDPERAVPRDPALALAPADGRVLAIERLADDRFGPGEWLRVAIFLSVLDVHVNRSPVAGRVVRQFDQAGGYGHAGREGAAGNASRYTVIEGVHGPAVVAQRVGAVARRIVTWVRPGELLAQGDRYGLIRFGSRTDLYLPAARWTALVAPGDTVRGGLTALARCSDPWPR
jgi:phosphatidylserine decarboxylase